MKVPFEFSAWWSYLTTRTYPLPWFVVVCLVLVGLVVALSPLWHSLRPIVAIAHEGGHALVGVFTGAKIDGVGVFADTSGVTSFSAPSTFTVLMVTLAGYPAPCWFAFWMLLGVVLGFAPIALLLGVLGLFLLVLSSSNWWGFFRLSALFLALLVVSLFLPASVACVILALLAGFFYVGGVRTLWEERAARPEPGDTDVEALPGSGKFVDGFWWWFLCALCILPAALLSAVVVYLYQRS